VSHFAEGPIPRICDSHLEEETHHKKKENGGGKSRQEMKQSSSERGHLFLQNMITFLERNSGSRPRSPHP